jgi:hypothetical protein
VVAAVDLLNLREAHRYARRVAERWPLQGAWLGGARVDDAHGAGEQRERGEEYLAVLVSEGFDGVPWLERVYVAESLWDASEMGAPVEAHSYTPAEQVRREQSLPRVAHAVAEGIDLLAG